MPYGVRHHTRRIALGGDAPRSFLPCWNLLANEKLPWQSSEVVRYSERLHWSSSRNSLTLLIEAKRSAGEKLLDLTVSNPTEVLPDYPHVQIANALCSIRDFTYRPDSFGLPAARAIIAGIYGKYGISLEASQIALTASTSEAYGLLFKLLCNPGDEILVPVPCYPLFEYLAKLECVRIVPYRLSYDGSWFLDFADLEERISPATRALVVINPHNPTGSFLKQPEASRLIALAQERQIPIISDEVFMEYALDDDSSRIATLAGHESGLMFSLNGLSKMAGMPQMKLGWIAISGSEQERSSVLPRLEVLLDAYLSVNTPIQLALPELLRIGGELCEALHLRTKENMHFLREFLRNAPLHSLGAEGGWSELIRLPGTSSEEAWVTKFIQQQNVIVQPGYFFDMPSEAYIAVSLIVPPDTFREGIRRVAQAVIQC
ncbi:MAG: pyridoxal phosphate-dependent aminotransferase [Acidobacteriaceae bacterium]|nr:pyridoxal phosphate-dependent aminotransferase [Acidobacteriaceae bacterium]